MVKIKGVSYNVAWDALADLDFFEAMGIEDLSVEPDLRSLFGLDGVTIDENGNVDKSKVKIAPSTMRNLVSFCHIALITGSHPNPFPYDFREMYNILDSDSKMTRSLMGKAMDAYLSNKKIKTLKPDDEGEGKEKAAG